MQKLKQLMQKGISPVLAIIIIVVLSAIVGAGLLVWGYFWTRGVDEIEDFFVENQENIFKEFFLKDLKEGMNKIGETNVNRLALSPIKERSVLVNEKTLEIESKCDNNKGSFAIYYSNKEKLKLNYDDVLCDDISFYYFKYGIKDYIIFQGQKEKWAYYYFFLVDKEDINFLLHDESPRYLFRENKGYYLIDYNDYLYVISLYLDRYISGDYYGEIEINTLSKTGESKRFTFETSAEANFNIEEIYYQDISLIEKDAKLYLKIIDIKIGKDKYYLLGDGDLVETESQQLNIAEAEDETADWKTYRNEEYGFEIKCPNHWIAQEIIMENNLEYYENKFGYYAGPEPFPVLSVIVREDIASLDDFVSIEENRLNRSRSKVIKGVGENGFIELKDAYIDKKILGLDARELKLEFPWGPFGIRTYIVNNNTGYIIQLYYFFTNDYWDEHSFIRDEEFFNFYYKILSTLRFIE